MSISSYLESSKPTSLKSYPIPRSSLDKILNDPEFKQNVHSRIKQGNPWISALYKIKILPLFGIGGQIMLLTTKGRKSLKMRDTPIGYFRIDGKIYVFSAWGKAANWYQNLAAFPQDVSVQVGFHHSHAIVEVVEDPGEKKRVIEGLIRQDPEGARTLMGWDPKRDDLEHADFSPMIEQVLVVGFRL